MPPHPLIVEDIFRPAAAYPRFLLAVSGGSDSMALMLLAARWLEARGEPSAKAHVLTVDHRLRPEAASEAAFTAATAARLGLGHTTLAWTGAKPATGIQAAAREARYRLMTAFALANGYPAILTAHHAGDQAETLLMRLARGSGLDGLAGMAPVSRMAGIDIVRPFLGVEKARLKAALRAAGQTWADDPSNTSRQFERVRLRQMLRTLRVHGITEASLALSATRLGRAREAVHTATEALAEQTLTMHPSGYGTLDLAALRTAPEELCTSLLSRAFKMFGGSARPPRLVQIEMLCATLRRGEAPRQLTLGGCILRTARAELYIAREPGRMGTPRLELQPGETAVWDGRFKAALAAQAPAPAEIAPLGAEVHTILPHLTGIARLAAETSPAFWRRNRLICAPAAGFLPLGEAEHCQSEFLATITFR